MSTGTAIRLEREKRRTMREEKLLALLNQPALQDQLALIGGVGATYALGRSRLINRDLAGVLCGLSAVVAAGRAGITDRYALAGIWGAVASAYALAVRPTDAETLIEFQPGGPLLGTDNKLFFWSLPDVASAIPVTGPLLHALLEGGP